MRLVLFAATILFAQTASADTIYLCRTLSRGKFWSSGFCTDRNAIMERAAAVPDRMPFDQQVEIARHSAGLVPSKPTPTTVRHQIAPKDSSTSPAMECASLRQQIRLIEQEQRKALSGQRQDQLTADKRRAEAQEMGLRCSTRR